MTEVVSDNGNRLRYQYNDNGRLVLVTDHTGRKVALVYEERKLVKVTVPSGSVYSYQYSENGRIKELVNAREVHAVCNEYDKNSVLSVRNLQMAVRWNLHIWMQIKK